MTTVSIFKALLQPLGQVESALYPIFFIADFDPTLLFSSFCPETVCDIRSSYGFGDPVIPELNTL